MKKVITNVILVVAFLIGMNANASADFTLTLSPTSETVQRGSNGGSQITLTSKGYCGLVNLVPTVSPKNNNLTLQIRNYDVNICHNDPGTTALTVGTTSQTPTGTYIITITGKALSSGVTHTATLTLTVTP